MNSTSGAGTYSINAHMLLSEFSLGGEKTVGVCEFRDTVLFYSVFVYIHNYLRFSACRCVLWRNGFKPNGLLINPIRRKRNKLLASWRPRLRNRYDLWPKINTIINDVWLTRAYILYSVSWGSRMLKWSKPKRHASRNGWPTNWETWRLRTSTSESKITSATSSWSCSDDTWPNLAPTKWPLVLVPGRLRRAPVHRPCTGPTALALHSEWKIPLLNNIIM